MRLRPSRVHTPPTPSRSRHLLRGARERDGRSPKALWLQLAKVAADDTLRLRTLVFRGLACANHFDLLTYGRSARAAELRAQPAELEGA